MHNLASLYVYPVSLWIKMKSGKNQNLFNGLLEFKYENLKWHVIIGLSDYDRGYDRILRSCPSVNVEV